MNKFRLTTLAVCLAVCSTVMPLWLNAQPNGSEATTAAAPQQEYALVEQFLQLQDHELDELIAILQRLRDMSAQQRSELANTVDRYRRMPAEQRRNLRDGTGRQAFGKHVDNDAWRNMMSTLSPDQRLEVHLRLQNAAPAERQATRQAILNQWQSSHPIESNQ